MLKDKGLEKTNVTVDWDRYVDEDEESFSFNTDSLEGGNDFSKEDISVNLKGELLESKSH